MVAFGPDISRTPTALLDMSGFGLKPLTAAAIKAEKGPRWQATRGADGALCATALPVAAGMHLPACIHLRKHYPFPCARIHIAIFRRCSASTIGSCCAASASTTNDAVISFSFTQRSYGALLRSTTSTTTTTTIPSGSAIFILAPGNKTTNHGPRTLHGPPHPRTALTTPSRTRIG